MKIVFHPAVKNELDQAVEWYENEEEGLGIRFANVIDEGILRIVRYPKFNTEIEPGLYRAQVPRFPYGIFYEINDDMIVIYAIAHLHRRPLYWKNRKG